MRVVGFVALIWAAAVWSYLGSVPAPAVSPCAIRPPSPAVIYYPPPARRAAAARVYLPGPDARSR